MSEEHVNASVSQPTVDSISDVQSLLEEKLSGVNRVAFLKEMFEQEKKLDPNAVCPACAGMPETSCDVCGKGKVVKTVDYFKLENDDVLGRLNIPEVFKSNSYNSDTLLSTKRNLQDNGAFQAYLKKTDRLLMSFLRGDPLLCSLFISAPSGFGKEHLVYSLLLSAIDTGKTVFPYIDLAEAQSLINSYEQGDAGDPIRSHIGFTDLEMYNADVCILKVPHSEHLMSFKTALTIIDRRARRNKSTIIISRYHFNYFSMKDTFKELVGLVQDSADRPKNLRVIEYVK